MEFALVLYPQFTMLDIVGPCQVLGDLPDAEIRWVASSPGHVIDHTGRAGLVASASLDDVPQPDVVVVPGGFGDTELDREVVAWLRRVHETTTWTTSVCTLGARYVAEPVAVSSGIDMALVLVERRFGRDQAELLQLAIEYDPKPPFDAGSPRKARKEIVEVAQAILADTLSDDAVADVVATVGGTG